MDRRALLAGSAAGLWGASARAQQACFDRLDCFDTKLPGPSLDLQFTSGTLDPRITFTRASVASYFDVAGTLQSAASGAPRFDFDPVTHLARGLLIEEARTNLLLNSATLGTQSVTVTAQAYTLSFYGTGTVTLSGVSTAGPLTGTGAFPQRVSLTFTPTAGTLTLTVSGSVLNANLEAGSFATSAIVTAGASATRAADVATMPVGSWLNSNVGTLVATAMMPVFNVAGQFPLIAEIAAGSFTNELGLFMSQAQPGETMVVGGVNNPNNTAGLAATAGVPYSLGIAWAAGAQSWAALGQSPGNSAVASIPAGLVTLYLGRTAFDGYIRRVRYWPRTLGAGELQAVTR